MTRKLSAVKTLAIKANSVTGAEVTFLSSVHVATLTYGHQSSSEFNTYFLAHYLFSQLVLSLLSRSESPSQVFVIVLRWLYETLQSIPPDKWAEVVVAYDNMCHLDRLRASQSPLPLPQPYDLMWRKVTKASSIVPLGVHCSFCLCLLMSYHINLSYA